MLLNLQFVDHTVPITQRVIQPKDSSWDIKPGDDMDLGDPLGRLGPNCPKRVLLDCSSRTRVYNREDFEKLKCSRGGGNGVFS